MGGVNEGGEGRVNGNRLRGGGGGGGEWRRGLNGGGGGEGTKNDTSRK